MRALIPRENLSSILTLDSGQENNQGTPLEWTSVTAVEAIRRLKQGALALDVRSPGEFAEGSLPGFKNIPILNDEHRHLVGLCYKTKGQDAAIELGLELVLPLKSGLVQQWRSCLAAEALEQRLLVCWRGGLRSKMAAAWLAESDFAGARVAGGYKAMRRELLAAISTPPQMIVLGGLTGTGKTDLLRELPPAQVIDLEDFANHRGSSFGLKIDSRQPSQTTFENRLGLSVFEGAVKRVVEAESRMVGSCAIPNEFKAAMDASPMIILEASMEDRIRHVFREYVFEPLEHFSVEQVCDHLQSALSRIERKLGGARTKAILSDLRLAFEAPPVVDRHASWIEQLLRDYYDPMYEHAFKANGREIAFRGSAAEIKAYVSESSAF